MAKNKTIAVDIGHGSDTFPPSKGVYAGGKGYAEHSFNAKLGVALEKKLKALGFKTVLYQKPNAKDVPLTQRTNHYNAQKVDLVFSIHANYNGDSNVNGRCVFYWGTSKPSKRMAEIVVKHIKDAGYSTHGNGLHAGERGSWTNLHINRETNMPAVLVENGFMSGNKDFDLVFGDKQAEYIEDMAEIHAKSIAEYFGVKGGSSTKPQKPKPSKPKEDSKPSKKPSSAYKGDSIVDYLNSIGEDSSLSNRAKLASRNGIKGYKGTSAQNTHLLKALRGDKSASKPSKTKPKANLSVDGKWGKGVTKALQKALGTTQDGIISRQPRNSVTQSFYGGTISFGSGNGSPLVRALQKKIAAKVDGKLGPATIRALQKYLGTAQDGVLSRPSPAVKEMQRRLNAGNF